MLARADVLCKRYHFDRHGDDGGSCVVRGPDGPDGKAVYWAVAIETAEDHELEAINVQTQRKLH